MKVTIRIEQDKYHFVKRSFKSLEEAERYIFMAKVAKTKNYLKNWCEVAEEGGEMSCNDLEIPILTGCRNF